MISAPFQSGWIAGAGVTRLLTICVVLVVPIEVHNSFPFVPSSAEKYNLSPAAVKEEAFDPEAPGWMSLTLTAS